LRSGFGGWRKKRKIWSMSVWVVVGGLFLLLFSFSNDAEWAGDVGKALTEEAVDEGALCQDFIELWYLTDLRKG
jgi:hypothetical protein